MTPLGNEQCDESTDVRVTRSGSELHPRIARENGWEIFNPAGDWFLYYEDGRRLEAGYAVNHGDEEENSKAMGAGPEETTKAHGAGPRETTPLREQLSIIKEKEEETKSAVITWNNHLAHLRTEPARWWSLKAD
jgi:hypothetical protein